VKKLTQHDKGMHSPIKRNVLQHKKLKPSLVAFHDIQSGNGEGLFSKEKINKKSEEKKDK